MRNAGETFPFVIPLFFCRPFFLSLLSIRRQIYADTHKRYSIESKGGGD